MRDATALNLGLAAVVGLAACDAVRTDTSDPVLHLAKRATFGPTPDLLDEIRVAGTSRWIDMQLDPGTLDTSGVDALVSQLPVVEMSARAMIDAYPSGTERGLAAAQLVQAALIRQVHSPAQLFERLVEFWSDHFNVAVLDDIGQALKPPEDRDVIRRNAIGTFSDLLVAPATSPAMLYYLDNAVSVAGAPNENYARELLELHTLGVDGGYTEADIVAVARLLTGWTIDRRSVSFTFREDLHDHGDVVVMDWRRPTSGDPFSHGTDFLRWLARHPATASHLARKLAVRFVADDPDPALVDDVAAAYLASGTSIPVTIRALFAHPGFGEAASTPKFRRPLDLLVAAIRAAGGRLVPSTDAEPVRAAGQVLAPLGQVPFQWPAPDGYPDTEAAWLTAGGLLSRWNVVAALVEGRVPLVDLDLGGLRRSADGLKAGDAVDLLAMTVLGEQLTQVGRSTILRNWGLGVHETPSPGLLDEWVPKTVTLLLISADFQYR